MWAQGKAVATRPSWSFPHATVEAAAVVARKRVRVRRNWALPVGALVLVVATVLALSRAAVPS